MINSDDYDEIELGKLLRERVRELHSDAGTFARTAVRLGNRAKRRRRITVATTTLSGLAAVVVLGVHPWTSQPPSGVPDGFSAAPTAHDRASHARESHSTSNGSRFNDCLARMRQAKKDGAPKAAPPKSAPKSSAARWYPLTTIGHSTAPHCSAPPGQPESLPVSLDAPGWSCDTPGDDKFSCSDGGDGVLVTVRPATFHDDYLNDPDKAGPSMFVSDVHGNVFATLQRVSGDESVIDLAQYLNWK